MASKRFIHIDQFTSDSVKFDGRGVSADAIENETKNVDLTLPHDVCITGSILIVVGGKVGDKVSLQVLHSSGIVVDQFVTDWFIAPDQAKQNEFQLNYPANVPSGFILRAVYTSTAEAGVRTVMINHVLHKVLVQE